MVWRHLSGMDYAALAVLALLLLAIVPVYYWDRRLRRRHAAAWHDAYFRKGGLVRVLMSRWRAGPPRLTDQRPPPDRDA
jgi:hypothetical protein